MVLCPCHDLNMFCYQLSRRNLSTRSLGILQSCFSHVSTSIIHCVSDRPRPGGPHLKKTQVYPDLFGRRVCRFHQKFVQDYLWPLQSMKTTWQIDLFNISMTNIFSFSASCFCNRSTGCPYKLEWRWPFSKFRTKNQLWPQPVLIDPTCPKCDDVRLFSLFPSD